MKRLLCIWFPNWPIQRIVVARPELQPAAVILSAWDSRRGQLVAACSRRAWQRGVRVGMPLAEATALLASASDVVVAHDPAADQRALEKLARWCETFSPIVGIEEGVAPSSLLGDITGVAARWGGEQPLAEHVGRQLRELGYWSRLGIADTIGAAWAVAHFDPISKGTSVGSTPAARKPAPRKPAARKPAARKPAAQGSRSATWHPVIRRVAPGQATSALAGLPIEALRLSEATVELLRNLGVERIEQLAALPRSGIASRLGEEVLLRLDQACGTRPEVAVVHRGPISFRAQWRAEYPTQRRAEIEQVVQHLSQHVAELLAEQQRGALQLVCRLRYEQISASADPVDLASSALHHPGSFAVWQFTVGLFHPTAQPDHFWQLLRMQLDGAPAAGSDHGGHVMGRDNLRTHPASATALGRRFPGSRSASAGRAD